MAGKSLGTQSKNYPATTLVSDTYNQFRLESGIHCTTLALRTSKCRKCDDWGFAAALGRKLPYLNE